MDSGRQIALFQQRLFRGKLHLPAFRCDIVSASSGAIDYSASLDTLEQFPLCGRQLNNHRASRSQQHDKLAYAGSAAEFTYQLLSNRACKPCAYASGLLVKSTQQVASPSEEEEFGYE